MEPLRFHVAWRSLSKQFSIGPRDVETKAWVEMQGETYLSMMRSLEEEVRIHKVAEDPAPGEAVRPRGIITPTLLTSMLRHKLENTFPSQRGNFCISKSVDLD